MKKLDSNRGQNYNMFCLFPDKICYQLNKTNIYSLIKTVDYIMQYSTFCGQKLCPNNSLNFVYYFVNLGASSTLKLFLYPTVVYRI